MRVVLRKVDAERQWAGHHALVRAPGSKSCGELSERRRLARARPACSTAQGGEGCVIAASPTDTTYGARFWREGSIRNEGTRKGIRARRRRCGPVRAT